MRVLGIETSAAHRGTVALAEAGKLVTSAEHTSLNAHAEKTLPLVEQILGEAGWTRSSLDRVAVGIGPGSFTGLRVGLALAQGIALGLGIPVVGVGSLRAMADAVPADREGHRVPLLDARRGELFAAVYTAGGDELAPPFVLARDEARSVLEARAPGARVLVGEVTGSLGLPGALRSARTDLPHAASTALLGAGLDPALAPAEPLYVREADAIKPDLPPSPFGQAG